MSAGRLLCVVALLACAWPEAALAEGPTESMSVWRIDGAEARVTVWVPIALVRRFGASGAGESPAEAESFARAGWLTGDYLARRLVLSTASGPCTPAGGGGGPASGPAAGVVDGEWSRHTWTVTCREARGFRLRDDAFFDDAPSHAHVARVRFEATASSFSSTALVEKVLTTGDRSFAAEPGTSAVAPLWRGLVAGIQPLTIALLVAVFASGWASGGRGLVGRASATVLGLALGARLSGEGAGVSVPIAGLAVLCVAFGSLARARPVVAAAVLSAAVGSILAQLLARSGLVLREAACACGLASLAVCVALRGRLAPFLDAAAALVVGLAVGRAAAIPAVWGASPGLALSSIAVLATSWPALLLVAAAAIVRRPTRGSARDGKTAGVPLALAAGVVAVALAWIATPLP